MPKYYDFTLSEEELLEVQAAMKSGDAKTAQRATMLHQLHLRYTVPSVAEVHQVDIGTVYNTYHRFKKEGVSGLPDKPRSGRPPKATGAYQERLEATLEISPEDLGLGFGVWTLPTLRAYLRQETGLDVSEARLSRLLEELGYVFRRPKHDLGHRQDETLREQVKEALEEVKKTPSPEKSAYSLWTKAGLV